MADNTPITLNCPSCGAPLDYDGTSSIIRCKFCKNVALVPGLPSAQEASPRAALDEVRQLAQNGNLIDAIRRYRELYGVGLKEAKDAVDALSAGKVIEVHRVFSGPLTADETSRVLDEVKDLLRSGDKIAAIKRYREVNDVSLTQAKDMIDQVNAALTGSPVPSGNRDYPEIPGTPSFTPQSQERNRSAWLGISIIVVILVIVGGVIAFAMFQPGGPFTPQLSAVSPAILLTADASAPPDVAALFYNSDKDTRLVGLVDGSTGKLRWQAEPLSGDGYADALAQSPDLLYAANGTDLLAYRKSDGSLAWQAQMPDKLNYSEDSLLVTDGRVLTLNLDQSLQAYDAATGELVWSRRLAGHDRALRLMDGSLVLLDYIGDDYTYSLVFLNPADGSQERVITPTCQYDQYSSDTLDTDSGLLYDEAENALYLVYGFSNGCIQKLDLASGQTTWQTVSEDSFNISSDGFNVLNTHSTLYFSNGSQLLVVDKVTGKLQTLLSNEDYDFVPLTITGSRIIVRARRTRGTERFELWGLDLASGERLWQMDLNATPLDPPNELSGLVDQGEPGWTWKLVADQLVLLQFQAAPNQLVLQTLNPADGTPASEITVPFKAVSGDFYAVPTMIGWQDNVIYFVLESKVYGVDITTGKVLFHYQ